MATKKKAQVISIDAVTEEQPQQVAPNQLALAIKPAKPTKLRINITQGKALAKESVQMIQKEVAAKQAALHTDLDYCAALQKYMEEDELATSLVKTNKALQGIDFNALNRQLNRFNDKRASGVSYISSISVSGVGNALDSLKIDFFKKYFVKELADLASISANEDAIYTRIMVSTINFTDNTTLLQFQRQTIADLYPRVVTVIPSLDPNKYVAEV